MKPPSESDREICPTCRSAVWPEHEDQTHRDCDCGQRIWFQDWAKEKFGSGSSPPDQVLPDDPPRPAADDSDNGSDGEESKQTSWDDYLP